MSHRVRLGNASSSGSASLRDRSALLGTTSSTSTSTSLLPPSSSSSSSTANFTRTSSTTLTPPGSGRSTPFGYHHRNDGDDDTSRSSGYRYQYGYGGGNNTRSGSGSGSGSGSNILPAGHRYADDLESQNDEAIEGLSAKVKLLKDITVGIGNEVRESTKQLSQMNDAFAETGGILQGTFRRMNNMASKQGCRWLWYIVFLVVVFWFFIVVWWFRR